MHRYLKPAAIGVLLALTPLWAARADSCAPNDAYLGSEPSVEPTIRYLSFPSSERGKSIVVSGRLQMPAVRAPSMPAVIIMHGTGGVSPRGVYYANALNQAGIVTFEIDQWGARGLAGGAESRPKTVPETLPDVFGALDLLAATPGVDPNRIGIMGFSWGGVVSMLVSTQRYQDQFGRPGGPKIAAAMPFYPVCWVYGHVPGYELNTMRPIPLRIVAAGADDYDDGAAPCQALVEKGLPSDSRPHASLKVYPGVGHAFDGFASLFRHDDPYGHRGKGGSVAIGPPASEARAAARADAVRFFTQALKP